MPGHCENEKVPHQGTERLYTQDELISILLRADVEARRKQQRTILGVLGLVVILIVGLWAGVHFGTTYPDFAKLAYESQYIVWPILGIATVFAIWLTSRK